MWKVRIYDNKFKEETNELVIPDPLAQMIFENPNIICVKDYPNIKIYASKTHTATFDRVMED